MAHQFKNIVLLSIDNLRPDCVSYVREQYNYPVDKTALGAQTPNLDSYLAKGTLFPHTYSAATYTTTSHATIMTGQFPVQHGVRPFMDIQDGILSLGSLTLAELLKEYEYETCLATDVPELFTTLSIDRGFDTVIARNDSQWQKWVEQNVDKKKFLFLHIFDVHEPYFYDESKDKFEQAQYKALIEKLYTEYNLPAEKHINPQEKPHTAWHAAWSEVGRPRSRAFPLYAQGVSWFDQHRGKRILEQFEQYGFFQDDTLLFIFSDHGEGYTDWNSTHFLHAGSLREDSLRVLLWSNFPFDYTDKRTSLTSIFANIDTLLFDGKYKNENSNAYIAERWISLQPSPGVQEDNTGKPVISQTLQDISYMLQERRFSIGEKDIVIFGRPELLISLSTRPMTTEDYIEKLYEYVLMRPSDEAGKRHWVATADATSRKKVVWSFVKAARHEYQKPYILHIEGWREFISQQDLSEQEIIELGHAIAEYEHLNTEETVTSLQLFFETLHAL